VFAVRATCGAGEYKCYNDRCVDAALVDNDYNDCGDNSDEGKLPRCVLTRGTRGY
jgi:hypothetical protein